MHVVVIGAGVIGVTTAYYLEKAGHEVTVIDSESEVAQGTSCANGAQLSYSFTDALARPEMLRKLPELILGLDSAFHIQKSFDRHFVRWGMQFLRQCTSKRAKANTIDVLGRAMRSAVLFDSLKDELPDNFSYRNVGKLVLLSSAQELLSARKSSDLKRNHGCDTQVISLDEAIDIEPAVGAMQHAYVGAIFADGDAVADARSFTETLSQHLQNLGTKFCMSTSVSELIIERGALRAIATSQGEIDADAVVLCSGAKSLELLQQRIDIYPVRGYSITLPEGNMTPSVSITDARRRIVWSSIEAGVRIAGFADFVGMKRTKDAERISTLLRIAKEAAPNAADYGVGEINGWAGNRPMTPDSCPRIGPTDVSGVFTNLGHGVLGWTLACDSGQQIARIIEDTGQARQAMAA